MNRPHPPSPESSPAKTGEATKGHERELIVSAEIPKKIQSNNELVKFHWRKYDQYKKSWFEFIGYLMPWRKEAPSEKRLVVITSYRKALLDRDNLIGGAKPIPDALKKQKLIRDDSEEWVEIEYKQELIKRGSGAPFEQEEKTKIEIFEMGATRKSPQQLEEKSEGFKKKTAMASAGGAGRRYLLSLRRDMVQGNDGGSDL